MLLLSTYFVVHTHHHISTTITGEAEVVRMRALPDACITVERCASPSGIRKVFLRFSAVSSLGKKEDGKPLNYAVTIFFSCVYPEDDTEIDVENLTAAMRAPYVREIEAASCNCFAGRSQSCHHVSQACHFVLYQRRAVRESPTSLECIWNHPSTAARDFVLRVKKYGKASASVFRPRDTLEDVRIAAAGGRSSWGGGILPVRSEATQEALLTFFRGLRVSNKGRACAAELWYAPLHAIEAQRLIVYQESVRRAKEDEEKRKTAGASAMRAARALRSPIDILSNAWLGMDEQPAPPPKLLLTTLKNRRPYFQHTPNWKISPHPVCPWCGPKERAQLHFDAHKRCRVWLQPKEAYGGKSLKDLWQEERTANRAGKPSHPEWIVPEVGET